jgi:hypothetical protein
MSWRKYNKNTGVHCYENNFSSMANQGPKIGTERKPDIFAKRDTTPSPGFYKTKSIFSKPED